MVAEELSFGSKKFILSRQAARLVKYSNDYIGELCRSGKVEARQIGRLWYVEESSLLAHKRENGKQGFGANKHREKRALYKETPAVRAQFKPASPAPAKGVHVYDGKKFVSSRIATHLTGYSNDYIGELCRSGKVEAMRKGKLWYIEKDSLLAHKKMHGKQGFGSNAIRGALQKRNEENKISFPFPNAEKPASALSPYLSKFAALALSVALVFGAYQIEKEGVASSLRTIAFPAGEPGETGIRHSNILENVGMSYAENLSRLLEPGQAALSLASIGDGIGAALRKAGDGLADLLFGDFGYELVVTAPAGDDTKFLIEELTRMKEKLSALERAPPTTPEGSLGGQGAPPRTIIERVVSGVTRSELTADLSLLENALRSELSRVAATARTENTATYYAVAATNNIDKLRSVAISSATISGSSFSGTTVTADTGTFGSLAVDSLTVDTASGSGSLSAGTTTLTNLVVSNTSTSTFAGPLTVAGSFSAQSGLFTISGTTTAENQLIAALVPTQAHTFGTWSPGVANSAVGNAPLYVNPASAAADTNLLGLAVAGAPKFIVDAEGDVFVNSLTSVGATTLSTTTASSFTVENGLTVGDAVGDTLTLNAGNILYQNFATSTLKNGVVNAFSFATSST
ncbi:MAG: hypothetical protein Q8Q36_03330, partial [bacterium]|nr:hypothetical protein [bacterium]